MFFQESFVMEYHFYNFDEEGAAFQVFDVSECYPEKTKKHMAIEFPGNSLIPGA